MANTHNGRLRPRNLDRDLARGDDFVTRFIGGATLGALAGGLLTAGGGILPGAMLGGIAGVIVPEAVSIISGSNGRES